MLLDRLDLNTVDDSMEQYLKYVTELIKDQYNAMHKSKRDMADAIFVMNVGGHIVDSTRPEIEYAKEHGKTVRYYE